MKAILSYASARDALEGLTCDGLREHDIRDWLWAIAELKRLEQRRRRRRELRSLRIAGVLLSTFDRYPGRFRNWAKEISRINSGLQTDRFAKTVNEGLGSQQLPKEWGGGTPKQRQTILEYYKLLPAVLTLYASHLKIISGMFRAFYGEVSSGFWWTP